MQFNKIETKEQALELIKILPEIIALDTEYVKGNPRTTTLLSVILADSERAWAVNPSLLPMLTPTIKSRKLIFLQDYNHCDSIIMLKNGCDLRDTNTHNLIDMHHLIDENAEHDLGSRIKTNFGDNYKAEFWEKYKNYEDAPEEAQIEYACKDGIYTYRLGIKDIIEVQSEEFNGLYEHIRRLSASLLETEINGLKVNVDLIKNTYSKTEYEIQESLQSLRKEFGEYCELWELQDWQKQIDKRTSERGKMGVRRPAFNFESDRQVAWLVYDALKSPIVNKTKNGNPKVDEETLSTLSESNELIKPILEFKRLKSLFGTFIKGMLERVEDGRIYPHFNVSGTATGRLSHSDPNMGNLPKTGIIRNFFIPNDGMVFIGADYSQLEVVIEANLTEDPSLLKIILEGKSKHDITAEGLGINRNSAKTLNFALQYGAGPTKVASILGVTKQEAEDIYQRYWKLYSGVQALKDEVNKEIQEKGQITSLAGRTRHFEPVSNKYELFKQQRQAYNFLIQGLAAECCNRAFYIFSNWLKETGYGRGLFSVHDEILCEVWGQNPQDPYFLMDQLVQTMEAISEDFNFKYPLKAVAYGPLDKWSKE
jgi:DNA polymerase I-like protein with 3'-5' exonuclease and polymerase domains